MIRVWKFRTSISLADYIMRLHLAVPGRNFSLLNVGAWAQNIPVDTFDVPLFLFEQLNDPLSLCLRSLFDLVREAKLSSLEVEIALGDRLLIRRVRHKFLPRWIIGLMRRIFPSRPQLATSPNFSLHKWLDIYYFLILSTSHSLITRIRTKLLKKLEVLRNRWIDVLDLDEALGGIVDTFNIPFDVF